MQLNVVWPSLIKSSLTTIVLRLKGIWYCLIVARGSLKILACHSLPKYWMQKIHKSWTKFVTTSPGQPYITFGKNILYIFWHISYRYIFSMWDRWPPKMTFTKFQIFLKMSRAVMVEIVHLSPRVVIDCCEIHTINSLIKTNSRLISLCPKLYLG